MCKITILYIGSAFSYLTEKLPFQKKIKKLPKKNHHVPDPDEYIHNMRYTLSN